MPSAADYLIARLQADCTAAEAAERAVRASVDAQLRDPERNRAIAVELVALFRDIGWIETSLDELSHLRIDEVAR